MRDAKETADPIPGLGFGFGFGLLLCAAFLVGILSAREAYSRPAGDIQPDWPFIALFAALLIYLHCYAAYCLWKWRKRVTARGLFTGAMGLLAFGVLSVVLAVVIHVLAGHRPSHPEQKPGEATTVQFLLLYYVHGYWGGRFLVLGYTLIALAPLSLLAGIAKRLSGKNEGKDQDPALLFGAATPREAPGDRQKEHAKYHVRHLSEQDDGYEWGEFQIALLDEAGERRAEGSFFSGSALVNIKGHDVPRSIIDAAAKTPVGSELYLDSDGNLVEGGPASPTVA